MFVLHVHDRYSALGGADWHLLSVLDALPAGVRLAGLFGRDDGSTSFALDPAGRAANIDRRFIKKLDKKAPHAAEGNVAKKILAALDELGPDLVHVHNILNPYVLQTLARSGPSIITVQDHRFFCPGAGKVLAGGEPCRTVFGPDCANCFRDQKYFRRLLELVAARLEAVRGFHAVVVLSQYMKTELAAAGLDAERIHVIPPFPHGLDYGGDTASSGRGLLFAGRLVRAKGVFDLLDALALAGDDVEAVISGRGTVDAEVEEAVRRLGVAGRVSLPGWTDHAGMAALYRSARVVVLPSLWQEPFGITGLEAHYMARPVVAYDVGGVRDWLLSGETGLIVPPGDVEALARALASLVRDSDRADALGRAGRERAQKLFGRDELTVRLVDLYQKVVATS